jgi:hypothetical protein
MKIILFALTLPAVLIGQEWTMLVYMAADNDLAQWADSDLVEMEQFGSSQDINVIVQIDKPSVGARRLLVRHGSSQVLQELGLTDMCSWETLSDFLYWGITLFPAEKYLVILWDHGSGWTATPRKSFGTDWSSGNVLSIATGDFKRALSTAYDYTQTRINVFAFDACLMQQVEVAFEVGEYAKIHLAPQSIMPLPGFRYDEILEVLHSEPSIGETQLSQRIVQSTVDNYTDFQPIAVSAVRLAGLDNMKDKMVRLNNLLLSELPNQALVDLRRTVQTIPTIGCTPDTSDDYVDLGDFVAGMATVFDYGEADILLEAYEGAIIIADHWGQEFSGTTGLAVWFPDKYLQFKQIVDRYTSLNWVQSRWLEFLNWFYNADDVRPTTPHMIAKEPGAHNDFSLYWSKAYDLASVKYAVAEAMDTVLAFNDACEDSSLWNLSGFMLSSVNAHSGSYSFFSGNSANLSNYIETKDNITIQSLGMLIIYLYYRTEDMSDSLIIQYGPFQDVHYGISDGWIERRTILPSGSYRLRIFYVTDNSVNMGGCYIDDIRFFDLTHGRLIKQSHRDTSIYVYNKLRGDYLHSVWATDRYNNKSNLSNLTSISIQHYADPYSIPNPFQTTCYIAIDYPDTLNPSVEIYSLRGAAIKKYNADDIVSNRIFWDGKDNSGREVGSGIYFVLVKDRGFEKLGKIARQR